MGSELILTRGYPASGKTTWAKEWVSERPNIRVRLNRDDLRAMMFEVEGVGDFRQEAAVSIAQHETARKLLEDGYSVVFDDTNLLARYARGHKHLAESVHAGFRVVDFKTDFETCIDRDAYRISQGHRGVGAEVIRRFADRFPISNWYNTGEEL